MVNFIYDCGQAGSDCDYKQAVADEEKRHEQMLTKLEKQLKRDKEKTTVKLTVDRDHLEKMKLDLEGQVGQL